MIENYRDEEVCRAWDVVTRSHLSYVRSRILPHYRKNWWITLKKSGNDTKPVRKRSDFKLALSTSKRLHQKLEEPTRAHTLLEVQSMETGIEFFLYLVVMERILVIFLRIQRKSRKKRQAKACDRTEQPVVC